MRTVKLKVGFNTPAFLGNAVQQAQWRTPPFKALLRQWWRVAFVHDHPRLAGDELIAQMRTQEGEWFGNAWLDNGSHTRSRLSLRLSSWGPGALGGADWPTDIGQISTSDRTHLGADQFLGYGPLERERQGRAYVTKVNRFAVAPGSTGAELGLRFPVDFPLLDECLALAAAFGAIGSRARNGWGSLHLEGEDEGLSLPHAEQFGARLDSMSLPLDECLRNDWGAAFSRDEHGPMVWLSREVRDTWRQALPLAARARVEARRAAKEIRGAADPKRLAGLYYLGYPAGTGKNNPWSLFPREDKRFASPLRLKLIRSGKGMRVLVYAMPCMFPRDGFLDERGLDGNARRWLMDVNNAVRTWQAVAEALDEPTLGLCRIGDL